MLVLLVNANTDQLPDPIFPLGASFVAAAGAAGHEVQPLDLCFEDDPPLALQHAISKLQPDAVAFSLRNLDSSSYPICRSFVGDYIRLIQAAREACAAPLIVGVSAFTVAPRALLKALGADYGISGEGEEAFPQLLHWIASKGIWKDSSHIFLEKVGERSAREGPPRRVFPGWHAPACAASF